MKGLPRRAYAVRGPAYQSRARCPLCSASLGVRDIRRGMRLLAEHSEGRARIVGGEPRCDGSSLNLSDSPEAVAIAASRSLPRSPRAVTYPRD